METVIRNPNHPKKGSVIRVDPIHNMSVTALIVRWGACN